MASSPQPSSKTVTNTSSSFPTLKENAKLKHIQYIYIEILLPPLAILVPRCCHSRETLTSTESTDEDVNELDKLKDRGTNALLSVERYSTTATTKKKSTSQVKRHCG